MSLLEFFEKVIVINLESRRDRLDRMTQKLGALGVPFERFAAIQPTHNAPFKMKGQLGCFLSHIRLWKMVAESNFRNPVVILEDDCHFRSDSLDIIARFMDFLSSVKWDIGYLGCVFPPRLRNDENRIDRVAIKVRECWGAHAYFIRPESLPLLLSIAAVFEELSWIGDHNIDDLINFHHDRLERYAIYPTTAIQEDDFSDIYGKRVEKEKQFDGSFSMPFPPRQSLRS